MEGSIFCRNYSHTKQGPDQLSDRAHLARILLSVGHVKRLKAVWGQQHSLWSPVLLPTVSSPGLGHSFPALPVTVSQACMLLHTPLAPRAAVTPAFLPLLHCHHLLVVSCSTSPT